MAFLGWFTGGTCRSNIAACYWSLQALGCRYPNSSRFIDCFFKEFRNEKLCVVKHKHT